MPKSTTADLAEVLPIDRPRVSKAPANRPEPALAATPVLLVEGDPLLAEMLTATLKLHRGELEPRLATDFDTALKLAKEMELALILVDFGASVSSSGRDLLTALARLQPLAPVLALAEGSTEALTTLLDFDLTVVTKPPDIDHLLRRVDQLLERRAGSLLREIHLASLLQMLESERKTCRITASGRESEGRLWLEDGQLVHAESPSAEGVAALFEMLSWEEPVLRIHRQASPKHTVHRELRGLLLRFCVEQDHRQRDSEAG